jgi:hypothetical protein
MGKGKGLSQGEASMEPGHSEPGESGVSRQPATNRTENSADYGHLEKFQISPISQYENHCDNWLAPDPQGRERQFFKVALHNRAINMDSTKQAQPWQSKAAQKIPSLISISKNPKSHWTHCARSTAVTDLLPTRRGEMGNFRSDLIGIKT